MRLLAEAQLSYTRLDTEIGPQDEAERASALLLFGANVDLTYFLRGVDFNFGGLL